MILNHIDYYNEIYRQLKNVASNEPIKSDPPLPVLHLIQTVVDEVLLLSHIEEPTT